MGYIMGLRTATKGEKFVPIKAIQPIDGGHPDKAILILYDFEYIAMTEAVTKIEHLNLYIIFLGQ